MKQKKKKPAKIAKLPLTSREFSALKHAAMEFTKEQIAAKVSMSSHTVDWDLRMIRQKLGVQSITGAVHQAWKAGIFTKENC
ncbi:MAG: hypothetical protein HY841_12020 [Bacteroidetes bacterium]|nr:hypothetical protein [Bacteroidota bacterium]